MNDRRQPFPCYNRRANIMRRITTLIIFVAILACVLGLTHAVMYETVVHAFSIVSRSRLDLLRIVFGALAASFIVVSILSNKYDSIVTRFIYRASSVWLGFAMWLLLFSVLYWITDGIFSGWFVLTATLAMGIYGLIHADNIQITRYMIALPALPAAWRGKTAALVSDMHLGQVNGAAFAKKVSDQIESLRPDIIFVDGDLFDGVKVDVDAVVSPLSRLRAPHGIYFVTGNHEEFGANDHFIAAVRKIGIRVLDNEKVELDGLQIIGVDDHDSNIPGSFGRILSEMGIDRSRPSILVKHQPSLLAAAEEAGISLQVSGHTHRAQMWPLSYITRAIYKGYDYGLKRLGAMQVCTSSGAGTWGPPLRVGTRAEVVVLTFL